MSNVIQFPKTDAPVDKTTNPEDDVTLAERLDRVRTSLAKINALLKELKATTRD